MNTQLHFIINIQNIFSRLGFYHVSKFVAISFILMARFSWCSGRRGERDVGGSVDEECNQRRVVAGLIVADEVKR